MVFRASPAVAARGFLLEAYRPGKLENLPMNDHIQVLPVSLSPHTLRRFIQEKEKNP
jgi:hypothetical protein